MWFKSAIILPQTDYAAPLLGPQPVTPKRPRNEAIARARQSICLIVAEGGG